MESVGSPIGEVEISIKSTQRGSSTAGTVTPNNSISSAYFRSYTGLPTDQVLVATPHPIPIKIDLDIMGPSLPDSGGRSTSGRFSVYTYHSVSCWVRVNILYDVDIMLLHPESL